MTSIDDVLAEFDKLMIEEYGKWKIGRVEAKSFIRTALEAAREAGRQEATGKMTIDYGVEYLESIRQEERQKILAIFEHDYAEFMKNNFDMGESEIFVRWNQALESLKKEI